MNDQSYDIVCHFSAVEDGPRLTRVLDSLPDEGAAKRRLFEFATWHGAIDRVSSDGCRFDTPDGVLFEMVRSRTSVL